MRTSSKDGKCDWAGGRVRQFEKGMCQAEQPIINIVNTVFRDWRQNTKSQFK